MTELDKVIHRANSHSDIGMMHLGIYSDIFRRVITECQGPILEIGTNRGGSALLWIETLRLLGDSRQVVTVDPYGRKPYTQGRVDQGFYEYGDDIYTDMKTLLAPYSEHTHFRMTSEDFLSDLYGSHLWVDGARVPLGGFSFCLLDGDHHPRGIISDYLNLRRWMAPGGVVLIDNVDWMGPELERILVHLGERVDSGIRYMALRHHP